MRVRIAAHSNIQEPSLTTRGAPAPHHFLYVCYMNWLQQQTQQACHVLPSITIRTTIPTILTTVIVIVVVLSATTRSPRSDATGCWSSTIFWIRPRSNASGERSTPRYGDHTASTSAICVRRDTISRRCRRRPGAVESSTSSTDPGRYVSPPIRDCSPGRDNCGRPITSRRRRRHHGGIYRQTNSIDGIPTDPGSTTTTTMTENKLGNWVMPISIASVIVCRHGYHRRSDRRYTHNDNNNRINRRQ